MEHYSTDWAARVYKPFEDDRPPDWEDIKDRIARRDKWECQRCGCKYRLSIHHIMPRIEGGGHNDENLITLRVDCHDTIELEGIRSASLIRNSLDEPIYDVREFSFDWHAWVYGGYRKPPYFVSAKQKSA